MRIKLLGLAVGFVLASSAASALTFVEGTDLPNVSAATVSNGAVFVGTLSQGANSLSGSSGGACIGQLSPATADCRNGDFQDSMLLTVAAGTKIDNITLITTSAFGPVDWKIRFDVSQAFANGSNVSTAVIDLDVVKNGINGPLLGLPLGAGNYSFSFFNASTGTMPQGVQEGYDYNWEIIADVEAVPVPASLLLMVGGLAAVAGIRRVTG